MLLFALDQNFPEPIVEALKASIAETELVPIRRIDRRLTSMDDWELILSLFHHPRPFDGLVSVDDGILWQPKEMFVLERTALTLVVARASGHDPVKATGLLLTHLGQICKKSSPDRGQIFKLQAGDRKPESPNSQINVIAGHQNVSARELVREHRLRDEEFARNPLAADSN